MGAQWYDACITLPGCDKNMPGCIMAMGRLNRPGLMIYGGTIKPGSLDDEPLDIISAFQCYGEYLAGKISDEKRQAIVRQSCPGAGACGGMYTANTMASAIEAMGMSLPYSSSTPAEDPAKLDECLRAGAAIRKLLELDIKPRDIMTRPAFENAMVLVMALGGSTNAVLHLIAMARSVGVELTIDDFQNGQRARALSGRPQAQRQVRDGRPASRRRHAGRHEVPARKRLARRRLHDGDRQDAGRKSRRAARTSKPGRTSIHSLEKPIKSTGHIRILRGNLAPDGAVAKITGKEGLRFSGPARVLRLRRRHAARRSREGSIKKGDVVIIRYEGPKGGPGMPEMLTPTSAIIGAGSRP